MTPEQQRATDIARQMGILGANETATGGVLMSKLEANPQLRAAYDAVSNSGASNSYQNGFVPMTVEPLSEWEKQGLTTMAQPPAFGNGSMVMANDMLQRMIQNPQAFAQQYTNPLATQYMGEAGDLTRQGSGQITFDEIQAAMNPYAGALKNRLSEEAQRARTEILANQGMRGARSFGDTAQGVRMGELDKEVLSKSSDIDYQQFADAKAMLEALRNRQLSGGGQMGNLGTAAQGITSNAMSGGLAGVGQTFNAGAGLTDLGFRKAQNQIDAGQYVRSYNQGVNDLIGSEMLTGQNEGERRLSNTLDFLQNYQSGMSGGTQGANTLQTLGGLGTFAGDLLPQFGTGGRYSSATQSAMNGVRGSMF